MGQDAFSIINENADTTQSDAQGLLEKLNSHEYSKIWSVTSLIYDKYLLIETKLKA